MLYNGVYFYLHVVDVDGVGGPGAGQLVGQLREDLR